MYTHYNDGLIILEMQCAIFKMFCNILFNFGLSNVMNFNDVCIIKTPYIPDTELESDVSIMDGYVFHCSMSQDKTQRCAYPLKPNRVPEVGSSRPHRCLNSLRPSDAYVRQ